MSMHYMCLPWAFYLYFSVLQATLLLGAIFLWSGKAKAPKNCASLAINSNKLFRPSTHHIRVEQASFIIHRSWHLYTLLLQNHSLHKHFQTNLATWMISDQTGSVQTGGMSATSDYKSNIFSQDVLKKKCILSCPPSVITQFALLRLRSTIYRLSRPWATRCPIQHIHSSCRSLDHHPLRIKERDAYRRRFSGIPVSSTCRHSLWLSLMLPVPPQLPLLLGVKSDLPYECAPWRDARGL